MLKQFFKIKSPGWDKVTEVAIKLSGSELKFHFPESNDKSLGYDSHHTNYNLYDNSNFEADAERQDLPTLPVLGNSWLITQPPFSGKHLARVKFSLQVQRAEEFSSVFLPGHLEKAIERFIYTDHGPAAGRQSIKCRINWQIKSFNNTEWCAYEQHFTTPYDEFEQRSFFHTPLTDKHFLTVNFSYIRSAEDSAVDDHINELIKRIMESFELNHSSDALNSLANLEVQRASFGYHETLPELSWKEQSAEDETTIYFRLLDKNKPQLGEASEQEMEEISKKLKSEAKAIRKQQIANAKAARQEVFAAQLNFGASD